MKWIKRIVIIAIVFLVVLWFLIPEEGSRELRNLPYLFGLLGLLLLWLIYRVCKLLFAAGDLMRRLRAQGFRARICALRLRQVRVRAEKDGCALELVLLIRRSRLLHYHFPDTEHAEIFKTTQMHAARHPKAMIVSPVIVGKAATRLLKTVKLLWSKDAVGGDARRVIVFDRLPRMVTDSVTRASLWHGDSVLGSEVLLFSLQKGVESAT